MTSLSDEVALEVNDEALSLEDVLRSAKWGDKLSFIQDAVDAALIRQAAAQLGLEVSDEELQQAADDFRAAEGLHEVPATEAWLAARWLTFEDWEMMLEASVITRKLRDALTDARVDQHFAENKLFFEAAAISHLVADDEDLAKELRAQIAEEEADFHALARQHSLDETTRPASGYVGLVRRKELEAASEAAIFGVAAGDIVGPIKTNAGWELIKVEALHRAALEETTREAIKSQLFDEWLDEQRRKAQISLPILEPN